MIIGKKHSIISNPEGVKYNGNNENISPLRGLRGGDDWFSIIITPLWG
jgi:hypothetical protein